MAQEDPNLVLAELRIEIEKRLRQLASVYGLKKTKGGVGALLRALGREKILNGEQQEVLADMVELMNAAVHGAEVDDRSAGWAINYGPRLLANLDARIIESGS